MVTAELVNWAPVMGQKASGETQEENQGGPEAGWEELAGPLRAPCEGLSLLCLGFQGGLCQV